MNYYNEIKNKLIDNEIYSKVKDYSKERQKVITYFEIGKLLDEAGINAWREQVDFLGRGDGMIEHIWCEYGIDKRRFSV